MKHIINGIVFFNFLFLSINLNAQENTLLWEITGNGLTKPSYLFGTYHSYDSRAHHFGDSVILKLSKADAIAIENIDSENLSNKKIFELAFMKDKKLEDLITKENFDFIQEKAIDKMGASGLLVNKMKPFFTMIMLSKLNTRQETLYTVDGEIKNEGEKTGKKIYGLETTEDVIRSIESIKLEDQCNMLIDYFKNYERNILMNDSIVKLYQSQNLKILYQIYNNNKEFKQTFEYSFLDKRNKKFTENLINITKKQSVFCAIGFLHLLGENGLINSLRRQGYKVSPIFSNNTSKEKYFADNRKWFNYSSDSLMVSMKFPSSSLVENDSFTDTINKINSTEYSLNDTIFNIKYSVSIIENFEPNQTHNSKIYDSIINKLGSFNRWIKVKDNKIMYNGLEARELEFNITKGINKRYFILEKGKFLYLISVTGNKKNIYSNVAESFFYEIKLLNPILFLHLNITDEISEKPLQKFQISIKSSKLDTTIIPDEIGSISITLPTKEDEYLITTFSDGYVSKKILINTFQIDKTGESEIQLIGDITMIKKNKRLNSEIFDIPVAKAKLIDNNVFSWDIEYINKMKELRTKNGGYKQ